MDWGDEAGEERGGSTARTRGLTAAVVRALAGRDLRHRPRRRRPCKRRPRPSPAAPSPAATAAVVRDLCRRPRRRLPFLAATPSRPGLHAHAAVLDLSAQRRRRRPPSAAREGGSGGGAAPLRHRLRSVAVIRSVAGRAVARHNRRRCPRPLPSSASSPAETAAVGRAVTSLSPSPGTSRGLERGGGRRKRRRLTGGSIG
uniref:Uncharacterized protein n=1 Tax=Oryza meridionalis TaxID=40149 RepID=A0A0E0EGV5_9ORYZ